MDRFLWSIGIANDELGLQLRLGLGIDPSESIDGGATKKILSSGTAQTHQPNLYGSVTWSKNFLVSTTARNVEQARIPHSVSYSTNNG